MSVVLSYYTYLHLFHVCHKYYSVSLSVTTLPGISQVGSVWMHYLYDVLSTCCIASQTLRNIQTMLFHERKRPKPLPISMQALFFVIFFIQHSIHGRQVIYIILQYEAKHDYKLVIVTLLLPATVYFMQIDGLLGMINYV